jgi:transcriptional repressor NrdR
MVVTSRSSEFCKASSMSDTAASSVSMDTGRFSQAIIICEKRPVSLGQIEKAVDLIEKELYNLLDDEIKSSLIGEKIMQRLKEIDEVAYVRFASVYRQFKDINTFYDELNRMIREK